MRSAIVGLTAMALVGGCSTATNQCLQTPISSKVQAQAIQTCEEALKSELDRQDVYHQYMGLLRVRERFDEMADWSRRIIARDAKRTDAVYNLAYALRKTGNCNEALKRYKAYADANTEDADPYFGMGLCYEDLGNRGAAVSAYEVYIKKEKRQSQESWTGKARERIALLQGASTLTPVAARPPTPVAVNPPTPVAVNPPTPVAVNPPTPVAVNPPTPVAPPKAPPPPPPPAPKPTPPPSTDCSVHEKAISADPFATAAYDKFAECAMNARRYSDIIQRMRTAIRDNPDYTRGYFHLGRAYKATGDQVQAKAALGKACAAGVAEACGM